MTEETTSKAQGILLNSDTPNVDIPGAISNDSIVDIDRKIKIAKGSFYPLYMQIITLFPSFLPSFIFEMKIKR